MKRTKTTKRSSAKRNKFVSNRWVQKLAFPGALLLGLGVIGLAIWWLPSRDPGAQVGVGADGFSVKELKGVDLGVADVVSKAIAEQELKSVAQKVGNVNKSGTLSLNGNRNQTATYYFKSNAGTQSTLYVDVLIYKNATALKSDNLNKRTADAGKINGNEARYMHAATIGSEREYALLVTKDLKSYKFAITQPAKNITINEVTSQEILKKVAARANL
jgi:hypothetical protein